MSLSKYKTTSPAKKESGKILDLDITISSSKGRLSKDDWGTTSEKGNRRTQASMEAWY